MTKKKKNTEDGKQKSEDRELKGTINNVQIFDKALSDKEVKQKYKESVDNTVDEQVDKTVDEAEQDKKSAEAPAAPERGTRWHFPNASQCPRCRTHDTVATSTRGNKQYRVCRRGHCRYRYCVKGVKEK